MPENSLACPRFSFIEGYSNAAENTWECHTHPRFSLSKGIRMPLRIPENVIHILVSLCRRVFECRWEYLRMSYTSSFLFVEGYSNVVENTWGCHTHPRFSLSKGIRMSLRIPENVIHILVSLCRRVFECRLRIPPRSFPSYIATLLIYSLGHVFIYSPLGSSSSSDISLGISKPILWSFRTSYY